MVTRHSRISQFTTDAHPPKEALVEVLCEDHRGTYVVPFACRYDDAGWRRSVLSDRLDRDCSPRYNRAAVRFPAAHSHSQAGPDEGSRKVPAVCLPNLARS